MSNATPEFSLADQLAALRNNARSCRRAGNKNKALILDRRADELEREIKAASKPAPKPAAKPAKRRA